MSSTTLNTAALGPLFKPWDEPTAHRVRAEKRGDPAVIVPHRRPSPILIAHNLRQALRDWRAGMYAGASDTSINLLNHWFSRSHRVDAGATQIDFRYYFCQREAIEALIYLYEVRRLRRLSQIVAEFGGPTGELDALGVPDDEDAWARYAFKLATGSGKTKVMSLAIVWSYFHAGYEPDSDLPRHFVVIAPGLTVYERLKDDFAPPGGGPDIFDRDPLIPPEWRGDWNLSVVLQDASGGAATEGVLYLTNIHRLYDPGNRRTREPETYGWMGPAVSRQKALDTGEALRDRVTAHPRVMVLNDEAHHLWDPDSAWNEAIKYLDQTIRSRGGGGVTAQLDFSATPKDNSGRLFKHIVCDTPLGEAVDGGIVKTPILGLADEKLHEQPSDDASERWERHLLLGYERWKRSFEEWSGSGRQPLMFVMCEDTKAADQITRQLNTNPMYEALNGRTFNLHTNLKGKLKKVGKGKDARIEFIENEKEISDDDLRMLRELSRRLDEGTSPYRCIVSVLMLREGWDVKSVTTIVPLRPYSAKANILPEQTLGRGLRRMTPPGQANEVVTVVDHPAFRDFYRKELEQEGAIIEEERTERVPATTVSIFPDEGRKDLKALELVIPRLGAAHRVEEKVEGLTIDDVRKAFERFKPLPLGRAMKDHIDYEGRHLVTDEVVERTKINLPLLKSGVGAVGYYVKELEHICKIRGLHAAVGGLLQTFLEEILFEKPTTLFDPTLVSRLADSDVREHIRAVFVPLVRARTVRTESRTTDEGGIPLSTWRPFQVTHSERHPVLEASKTLFNLVPCNRELELAVARYLDAAGDVAAFAKNAGPQALRIDYLTPDKRLAFYTPDFFARSAEGRHYLIETKGREDKDVPRKARAAMAWCAAASASRPWQYVYVPQGVFERLSGATKVEDLARACEPALSDLMETENDEETRPLLALMAKAEEKPTPPEDIVPRAVVEGLPERARRAVEQATALYRFFENKEGMNFAPTFTALLGVMDDAARVSINARLLADVPTAPPAQRSWFEPHLGRLEGGARRHYEGMAQNLKKTLLYQSGVSPLGLLRSCLDYALNDPTKLTGVFDAVRAKFRVAGARDLLAAVSAVYEFRNTVVAHQEKELTDPAVAKQQLLAWVHALRRVHDLR